MNPLTLLAHVFAFSRQEGEPWSKVLLAAGAAALLVVPVAAAETSPSTQEIATPTPSPEKTQAEREKILFYAEAARQSLVDSHDVNEGKDPSGTTIPKYWLWDRVALIQARAGDIPAALATAAAHRRPQEDKGAVYSEIAIEQARTGDVAGAKESAKRDKSSDEDRLNRTRGEIALAEARTGRWQAAQAMLAAPPLAEDDPAPSEGLYDAFAGKVLAGNAQDEARLEQLLATVPADEAKALPDFERMLTLQAVGQARTNQLDKARSTLAKIESEPRKVWVLRNIALQRARAGDTADARKTLEPARGLLEANFAAADKGAIENKTVEKYRRIDLRRRLALTQVRIGDEEGARQTLEPLKASDKPPYERALGELAGAQAEWILPADKRPTERNSRLKSENLIRDISYEDERALAWGYVAQAELKKGQVEQARLSARRGVNLLQAAKEDEFLMALGGWSMIRAEAELGDPAEALRVARLIQPDPKDSRIAQEIAQIPLVVARRQDTKAAQSWVEQQTTDPYARAIYYARMGIALTGPDIPTWCVDTEDE